MKRSVLFFFILVLCLIPAVFLTAQAAQYTDGSYTLKYADAELGSVTVTVTITSGRLAAVTFPEGMGDVTLTQTELGAWLTSFIAAPDFMTVDVVSGASQSCNLIQYAVKNALIQAQKK